MGLGSISRTAAAPVTIYLPAIRRRSVPRSAPQMLDSVANYYVRTTSPVIDLRTQEQQIERRNSQERMFAQLSGFFGVAALILACVGLYG